MLRAASVAALIMRLLSQSRAPMIAGQVSRLGDEPP
jgi:hypothetical protein